MQLFQLLLLILYTKVSIDLKLKKPYPKMSYLEKNSSKYISFKEVIISDNLENGKGRI